MRSMRFLIFLGAIFLVGSIGGAQAQSTDETPPFPGDVSPSGLAALVSAGVDSTDTTGVQSVLPEVMAKAVRDWLHQTYEVRAGHVRTGLLSIPMGPANVRVNNPAGDAIGETQAEVAVAAFRDTVLVGFNDSKGFTAGFTISSFGYSTNGGATFTDGGNVPRTLPTDQAFGDPGVDTDEQGNWYFSQIYTVGTTQQNIGVHHGRFNGAGQLIWANPVQASIGTGPTGFLDKCLIACDRVTGNVYVSYTRFTANPRIEIARSTTHGASWDPAVLLDQGVTPTASKQAARPFCGPNGEVYVVWEKGANLINCPDSLGNVSNSSGTMAFTRSLNFGASYDPFKIIGTIEHSWTWSGPGDLRERANEFPDIAVDRSGGSMNGNIYVLWHESAPWTSNLAPGPANPELNNVADNNPGGAQLFSVGQDVTGSISAGAPADLDYWQFSAVQGKSYLLNLDPQGFVCGVSGTAKGMRMRLFATQSPYPVANAFPDTLLAASALGTFAQRIVWTAPKTGNYLVRLQASSGAVPFTYILRVRPLTFGVPSPARDARDVVVVHSSNQGGTWSAEQLINDDPPGLENRRPFICVDALGHVHAFWHDSRTPGLGSNAALTSVFGTTSRDGGLTWTPNYCVTDELSFFSFNTLAVPNLGDYNQAAATGALIHPAWSDQRLSTGDVRNPVPPPNFTAGTGPETFTTGLLFDFSVSCPADLEVCTLGGSFPRTFTITNTGNVPDSWSWGASQEGSAITISPSSGITGLVAPGAAVHVTVTVTVPADCAYPSSTTLTFSATPVGDPDGAKSCTSAISCPVFMTLDLDPNTFNLRSMGNWVTGFLEPPAPFTAEQIDVASIRLEGSVAVDPDGPTGIVGHGSSGTPNLMVKVSRPELELLLSPGASVPVTVTGTIDGHCFIGQDFIRIINAPVTHPAQGNSVAAGRPTTIEWQTPNGVHPQSVAVLWSSDKGANWNLVDPSLPNSGSYLWSVPQVLTEEAKVAVVLIESSDGGFIVDGVLGVSGVFTVREVTGVGDQGRATLGLHIVSPVASARGLEVAFSLPDGQPATLAVYDVVGRKVASRDVGDLGVGEHTTRFGERTSLPAGIYVVQLIQGGHTVTARAALIH